MPYLLHRDRGLWISNPGLNACFPMLDCFLACFLRTGTHDNLEPGSPGRASLDWRRGRLPAVRPPPQAVRSSGGAPGCPCASRALAPTPARLRWRASSSFRACSSQLLERQRYFGRSLTRASVLCSSHVIPAQSPVSCRRRQGGASGTFSPTHGSHPIHQVLSHPHHCGQPHTSHASAGRDMPASKLLQDQQYQSARVQASISSRPSTK